jgi:hypothetical protein
VTRFARALLLWLALTSGVVATGVAQQDAAAPPSKTTPANDIFSGTVSELASDSITVIRKAPARDAGARKFLLDAQTKVEGKLKVKARVTVRYQADDEGQLHALHIIVR